MAEEAFTVIELQSCCLEGLMFINGLKVRVTMSIDSRRSRYCKASPVAATSGTLALERLQVPNTMADPTKHPLFGFTPREVTAKQVRGAIVRGDFNLIYIVFLMP